jgi:hypothetical protein
MVSDHQKSSHLLPKEDINRWAPTLRCVQESPAVDLNQIANAAQKELAAFLSAVSQVFGPSNVQHAANLWLSGWEATEWNPENAERTFRHITIHTAAQLMRDTQSSIPRCSFEQWPELKRAS